MPQELRVANFEKGFTDNYVNGPSNAGQEYDNLLISRNTKPFSRPGSEMYDATLNELPAGRQRIQHLEIDQGTLFEFSGDEIYYRDGSYNELLGPKDSFDAFGDLGNPTSSRCSTAKWQKHVFATISDMARPRKIYKDPSGAWQLRTAGLPKPVDVLCFAQLKALTIDAINKFNLHVADAARHNLANLPLQVSATGIVTPKILIDRINLLIKNYNTHEADVHASPVVYHKATLGNDYSQTKPAFVYSLQEAANAMISFKTQYNLHEANAVIHTGASTQAITATNPKTTFSVTPSVAGTGAHLYAICFKYEYKIDGITYIDRSAVMEISIANGANLASNYNTLSDLPVLSNTIFDGKEAWDIDNIKIEIYRTENNQIVQKLVGEVPNGITTYQDRVQDANLGFPIYTAGEILNFDEPPECKFVIQANDINWYLNVREYAQDRPYRVRHSFQLGPSGSPESFYVDMDDDVTGGGNVGIYPIIFTNDKTYRLEGIVDAQGRGFVKKRLVDDTVGCISHNSIVSIKDGLFFCALDGIYFTDGFKVQKVTEHLDQSFSRLVATAAQRSRVYGTYDRFNDRGYWAFTSTDTANENDIIWVLDAHWGFPNGEGTFTTFSGGVNFRPSALAFDGEDLVRADSRGYTFIHRDNLYTDPVIDTLSNPSDWLTKAVIYNYTSCAYSMGSEFQKKWVTRLLTIFKPVTNVSVLPQSINDDSGAARDMKEFRTRTVFEWGDPFFVWGDAEFVWNAPSTASAIRRFPKNGLRCIYKQVRYTNAFTVVANSDLFGSVTTDASTKRVTVTLSPTVDDFPPDLVDFEFQIDGISTGFQILSQVATVGVTPGYLIVADPENQLPTGVQPSWVIKGYRKGEQFFLEGYTIMFDYFGSGHKGYNIGDAGENL